MKYRNVDLNDPLVQKDIKDTEDYLKRQDQQLWFTLKLCALVTYVSGKLEGTELGDKIIYIWNWITNIF